MKSFSIGRFAAFPVLLILCLALPASAPCSAYGQGGSGADNRDMDALLSKAFKADQPGAAVIVTQKGKALLRKGYGMADLELNVPIEPDMVFRLGSITKQFTAVAVLMLAEQGKLGLQDPITKFFPDYPARGHTITVEHLLTHTSGIKSMTSMPEWASQWRKDFSVAEMIDFFKNQPMDFAPAEKWLYNNSGYFLLGAIIEKASGESYENFIRKNIFEPLGMSHSFYDRTERLIPRRVKGYQRSAQGFQNAPYLSMSQPYSAGSLASSVDDLAVWDSALWSNKLLKKESLAMAHTPYRLKGGSSTGYGYGWTLASYEGHRTVEHGGGIHGFATYELSLPDDGIFIAVLTNGSAGPDVAPERLAVRLAAIAVGKPVEEPKPITLQSAQLDRYVGVYAINDKEERTITSSSDRLFSQRTGGQRNPIFPLSETEFFIPNSLNRLVFSMDANGRVTGVELRPRAGMVERAARTNKPVSRREVQVESSVLAKYVGSYELAPNFNLVVTLEDGKLMTQATSQPKVEVFAESETRFFLKVVDAQIEFERDSSGNVAGLKLYQGGRIVPGKKVR